jgi:hypothetical protein
VLKMKFHLGGAPQGAALDVRGTKWQTGRRAVCLHARGAIVRRGWATTAWRLGCHSLARPAPPMLASDGASVLEVIETNGLGERIFLDDSMLAGTSAANLGAVRSGWRLHAEGLCTPPLQGVLRSGLRWKTDIVTRRDEATWAWRLSDRYLTLVRTWIQVEWRGAFVRSAAV